MKEIGHILSSMTRNRLFLSMGLGIVALGGLVSLSAVAQNALPLEQIDFHSNRQGGTRVFLYTGSIVPYKTIEAGDNKIILEFDHIQRGSTVRTHFEKANNINNVIIQPVGNERIRITIYGSGLGVPSIGFRDTPGSKAMDSNLGTNLNVPEKSSQTPRIHTPSQNQDSIPFSTASGSDFPEGSLDDASLGDIASLDPDTGKPARAQPTGKNDLMPLSGEDDLVSRYGLDPESNGTPETNPKNGLMNWLKNGTHLGFLLKGLALFALFSGFGIFLYRKLQTVSQQQAQEAPVGLSRQLSFRDLANSYDDMPVSGSRAPQQTPQRQNINRQDAQNIRAQRPGPQPELDALGRMVDQLSPKSAIGKTSTQRAIQQYQQQNPDPAARNKGRQPRPAAPEEALRHEIQRANAVQRESEKRYTPPAYKNASLGTKKKPMARPPVAAKANPNNNDMPKGNPEVLNFLRNVAELMEKDGNKNMAQRIQRSLKP